MMAKEKIERKAILKETLRELYLKSGNQCAFPGCTRIMINADGVFIGQICHIEAAEEGGERFNPDMSNDDRRAFANLMLMCYEHHQISNDVTRYTVAVLKQMKGAHEAKFSDPAKIIEDAIEDKASVVKVTECGSLAKLNEVLGWNHSADELAVCIEDVHWVSSRIQRLPIRTRQLLVVMTMRLKRIALRNGWRYDQDVPIREIAEACDLPRETVVEHIEIMRRYGLANGYQDDEPPYLDKAKLHESPCESFVFGDLREFHRRTGVSLYSILVDLRFDLLD
jgi:hypothetical protein